MAVLDLTKRGAEAVIARVALPGAQTNGNSVGVVGVAVDEDTNTVYAGAMQAGAEGTHLWAIDADNLNASNPKDRTLNEAKVTRLEAQLTEPLTLAA